MPVRSDVPGSTIGIGGRSRHAELRPLLLPRAHRGAAIRAGKLAAWRGSSAQTAKKTLNVTVISLIVPIRPNHGYRSWQFARLRGYLCADAVIFFWIGLRVSGSRKTNQP